MVEIQPLNCKTNICLLPFQRQPKGPGPGEVGLELWFKGLGYRKLTREMAPKHLKSAVFLFRISCTPTPLVTAMLSGRGIRLWGPLGRECLHAVRRPSLEGLQVSLVRHGYGSKSTRKDMDCRFWSMCPLTRVTHFGVTLFFDNHSHMKKRV